MGVLVSFGKPLGTHSTKKKKGKSIGRKVTYSKIEGAMPAVLKITKNTIFKLMY